jgi:restriction system protein
MPDYEELMLPVLRIAGDGQEHRIGDVIEQLAKKFQLTDEERQQLLPSGKQTTFANRVHWARGYLVQAGLLEATRRAHFRITDRGRKVLTEGLSRIDGEYLSKFPEFIQFLDRSRRQRPLSPVGTEQPSAVRLQPAEAVILQQTPDELIS